MLCFFDIIFLFENENIWEILCFVIEMIINGYGARWYKMVVVFIIGFGWVILV